MTLQVPKHDCPSDGVTFVKGLEGLKKRRFLKSYQTKHQARGTYGYNSVSLRCLVSHATPTKGAVVYLFDVEFVTKDGQDILLTPKEAALWILKLSPRLTRLNKELRYVEDGRYVRGI